MGSFDRNRAALGAFGVLGVVVVSYLIYKKIGGKPEAQRKKTSHGQKSESDHVEKMVDEGSSKLNSEQDSNQMSYIVDGDGENNIVSSKKSDQSSDASSFDVVEAEEVEVSQAEKSSKLRDLDESLMDENETSKVQNESMASSSSFYHSAEDTMNKGKNDNSEISMTGQGDTSVTGEDFMTTRGCDGVSTTRSPGAKCDSEFSTDSKTEDKSVAETKTGSPTNYSSFTSITLGKKDNSAGDGVSPAHSSMSFSASKTASPPQQGNEISSQKEIPDEKAPEKELTTAEISDILNACQNTPMSVSKEQIYGLVQLLRKNEPALHQAVLDSIVRVSAFTQNLTALREAGCESEVCQQVIDGCALALKYGFKEESQLLALTKVLTNISMDPKALSNLETCVSALVVVLTDTQFTEEVQLSIIRPLINLCAEDGFHSYFIPAIPRLYALLDSGSSTVKLQSSKILVNLSINPNMILQMLSAKAPESLLDLLDKPTQADIILRVLTLIGNLRGTIAKQNIEQSSLPPANKAESPKTMYTALCGVVKSPLLRNKVYRLTRHSDGDIRLKASKLYTLLTMAKK